MTMENKKKTKNISWTEALDEFYKLKRIYDEDKQKEKLRIAELPNLSISDKRKEFQKLKFKCVDCGRKVGTKFTSKFDEKLEGKLQTAQCGDEVAPCGLNIRIFSGSTETYPCIIHELEKDIETLKNQIIFEKNKLLFGFVTSEDAVKKFDSYKEILGETTSRLASVMELYTLETSNREVEEAVIKVKQEIMLEIHALKEAIKKYDSTKDTHLIRDAVDIYRGQLQTKLNQLNNLLYKMRYVEYDEETGEHTLVQKATNIEQMELTYQENKVLAFHFGETNRAPAKETLVSAAATVTNTPATNEINKTFSLDKEGKIVWADVDYRELWEKLSKELKQSFVLEPVWMEHAMKQMVSKRKAGEPIEFVAPPNLILPPKELPDGTFDLGNEIYNDLYNSPDFDKSKEGEALKEALNLAIAAQLHFDSSL